MLLDGQFPGHDRLVAVGRTQHKHRTLVVMVLQMLHQAYLRLMFDGWCVGPSSPTRNESCVQT